MDPEPSINSTEAQTREGDYVSPGSQETSQIWGEIVPEA